MEMVLQTVYKFLYYGYYYYYSLPESMLLLRHAHVSSV